LTADAARRRRSSVQQAAHRVDFLGRAGDINDLDVSCHADLGKRRDFAEIDRGIKPLLSDEVL
jgi:hypothetical protein